MVQPLHALRHSASQTAGSCVAIGLAPGGAGLDIDRTELGRHIAGPDVPEFRGWGRAIPDFETGIWGFDTIKWRSVMGRSGRAMARHIALRTVAQGIGIGLRTGMHLDDEDNAANPVLNLVEQVRRSETLPARKRDTGVYRFDSRLQGDGETIFRDI